MLEPVRAADSPCSWISRSRQLGSRRPASSFLTSKMSLQIKPAVAARSARQAAARRILHTPDEGVGGEQRRQGGYNMHVQCYNMHVQMPAAASSGGSGRVGGATVRQEGGKSCLSLRCSFSAMQHHSSGGMSSRRSVWRPWRAWRAGLRA